MRARWSTNGSRCKARWHPLGWRADILSRRIISWLCQAPFVLQDADVRFYRRFMRSLSRQVRYLRRTLKQSRDGAAAAAGADRADLRGAVHAGPVARMLRGNARRLIDELARRSCPTAATSAAIPAR